jgi:hypothetical protein
MNTSKVILILIVLVVTGTWSCGPSSDNPIEPVLNPNLIYEGWWMAYDILDHFGHDGESYESDNFVIYSDACVLSEKQRVANILEGHLRDLMALLHITSHDEFWYTQPDKKLHIYLSMYLAFPWGGGFMDTHGFMLYAINSPLVNWPEEAYSMILKHELMHVVGGLLSHGILGDAWFIEGVAENVSNLSDMRTPVTTRNQLQEWIDEYQDEPYQGNPVAIHTYDDVMIIDPHASGDYDPYFELAFRYLIDPQGLARSWMDIKNIFLDMREGSNFAQAFESRIGMGLVFYEANFFNLMMAYLP